MAARAATTSPDVSTTDHEPQLALSDTVPGPVVDAPGVPAARPLRAWQNAALEKYFDPQREEPADYLVTATPGAGKTTFALACGFESASYFSRCYRQRFGLSPQEDRPHRSSAPELAAAAAGLPPG